jgi:hypothetical protein
VFEAMIAKAFAGSELRASSDAVDSCTRRGAARLGGRCSVGPMIGKDFADGWMHAGSHWRDSVEKLVRP